MYQHAVIADAVDVFSPNFQIIDGFRSGTRELLSYLRGFTAEKQDAFALIKLFGRDKILSVF